jgi:hypothetical protein
LETLAIIPFPLGLLLVFSLTFSYPHFILFFAKLQANILSPRPIVGKRCWRMMASIFFVNYKDERANYES